MDDSNNQAEDSKNKRLKYALCYLPIFPVVFFFTETKKSKEFMKHITYGFYLFVLYIILNILLYWLFGALLFLVYVGVVGFLVYKTYNGDEVKLDYIDKIDEKIKKSFDDVDYKENDK